MNESPFPAGPRPAVAILAAHGDAAAQSLAQGLEAGGFRVVRISLAAAEAAGSRSMARGYVVAFDPRSCDPFYGLAPAAVATRVADLVEGEGIEVLSVHGTSVGFNTLRTLAERRACRLVLTLPDDILADDGALPAGFSPTPQQRALRRMRHLETLAELDGLVVPSGARRDALAALGVPTPVTVVAATAPADLAGAYAGIFAETAPPPAPASEVSERVMPPEPVPPVRRVIPGRRAKV